MILEILSKFRLSIFVIAYLLLNINAFAVDDDVKKMITEASGISDNDAVTASQKKAVTLFDVYALAVKNTERLAIEGESSIQSEAKRQQAYGAFLPKVYLRANKYFAEKYKLGSSSQRDTIALYARQPIMTGLEEFSAFKASLSDIKIKKYNLNNNILQLLLDVSSSFYNVIQIEKSIKTGEEIINLYKRTLNELNRRAAIGRSRKSEVQRTITELYKLEAERKTLQNNLTRAKLALKTITGAKDDLKLTEGAEIPDPDYKIEGLKTLTERRWDIKTALETVEQAKARVLSAYGGNLPSIYADATYLLYYEKNSTSSGGNSRDYYFSMGAELPIFNGGITFAKIKEARSIKRQSELDLSRTIRFAEEDIIDSFQNWVSSKNEYEAFKKALDSAEENYKMVNNEYRLNLVTILDLITSLKSLQTAKDDYERSMLQHKLNRIKLAVAATELSGKNIGILKTE
ncbi:MAG: TolC family protein [Spirochaetota bacterium]